MDKQLTQQEIATMRLVRNSLVHRGQAPSIRDVMRALEYQSPRSANLIVNGLIEKGYLGRKEDGSLKLLRDLEKTTYNTQTIDVPLVGIVACGGPILAEENIEAMIPVSTSLAKPPHRYFLLRAKGDSMNQAGIQDGNILLVRQQEAANTGDRVVALIDDRATVKEFHPTSEAIILKPKSDNPSHQPIILNDDFEIQGVVVAALPNLME